MRVLLLGALILTGCAGPTTQPNSTEAVAEQKQRVLADRAKQREKNFTELRLEVRKLYVNDHPDLPADFRKAILKERIKVGMNMWDAIAAYSLWAYTTDPRAAKYRDTGVGALWTLVKHQQSTPDTQEEEWVLQRGKELQYLYFKKGVLTRVKD